MVVTAWLATAVAAVGLIGCSADSGAPTARSATSTATTMLGTLEAQVSVLARVARGTPVEVAMRITNRGDSAAAYGHVDELPPFDIVVVRPSGDTVWRRSDGGQHSLVLLSIPIAAGETSPLGVARWDQRDLRGRRVGPGSYLITAIYWAESPWVNTQVGPVTVRIDR